MDFICSGVSLALWTFISISECEASNHTEYKHPDVEGERAKAKLIGICVGVGLAMMFLVMLCISYNYYRHKAPADNKKEEPEAPKKQPISRVKQPEFKQVEEITQDTRF